MAMTAAQLCDLARQDAKVPGFTAQSGALLNMILEELCETYDFDLTKGVANVALTGSFGPYPLPADYLRTPLGGVNYTINGVAYKPRIYDYDDFTNLPQQAGVTGYPNIIATDMSASPPNLWVWPASAGVTMSMRYIKQMPNIATPETSASVPWFPNQGYLRTRLAGELMKLTDDTRVAAFLGDSPMGAQGILDRYLMKKDDSDNRMKRVHLDRNSFNSGSALRNTKKIGW